MIADGALSLAVSGVFALLSAHLLFRRRTPTDPLLAVLLVVLALITHLDRLALGAAGTASFKVGVLYLKSLLPCLVLGYAVLFSREARERSYYTRWSVPLLAGLLFPAAVLWLPVSAFYGTLDFQESRVVPLGRAGYWFYMGIMVYCVAALAALENTFASSSSVDRWRIKYEFVGMTGILGVLIFYFSQGLLFEAVNMNLLPVRSGVFLLSGVLIAFAKLFRAGGVAISVSRFVVYRSLTLLAVGIYLITLGLVGSGMRYFGIQLSVELMVFLGLGSGLLLLLLLFSEQLRRRAKVFVNKHFFAHKYDYRTEWLRFSENLAHCRSLPEVQQVILATYGSVFGIEGTALYLPDRKGPGLTLAAIEREGAVPLEFTPSAGLRRYLVEEHRVLNAESAEYGLTPAERDFLVGAGAWLAVPIVSRAYLEGIVLFRQRLVREELTFEDYDMMKTLASQAALSLMTYRLASELAEAGEMAAIAKVSSFVVHDLKNVAYTFSLMLENAERYIGDAEFQRDLLQSIKNSVGRMQALISKLKGMPSKETPRLEPVDLALVAAETLRQFAGGSRPGVRLTSDTQRAPVRGDAAELGKIALNLVLNALDAVAEGGDVRIRTGCRGDLAFLSVEDTGAGMSDYFVKKHLFRPFRTTKEGGLGIGLYQCSQIAEAHGGRIEVASKVGKGSTFTLHLPVEGPQTA